MREVAKLGDEKIPYRSFPLYAKACVEKYGYKVLDEELYESLGTQ